MRNSVRRITIQFAAENKELLKQIQTGFNEVGKEAKKANDQLKSFGNSLKAIFAGYIAQVGISNLMQMADSYSLLFDRIKVFTGSAETASEVFSKINDLARENNSSIESIATVYNRLSLSLSDVGVNSDQLLRITDLLTKSFRLSGATVSEATAATIQLSQGLASGQLRGQELRSVLEQNAIVGKLLADTLKVTRGQLMKMAEDGKITSEVFIKALNAGSVELDKNASQLGVTFEQVGLKIRDKFTVAVGEASKEMDVAGKLSKGIDFVSEKSEALAAAFGVLAVGFAAMKVSIAAVIGGLVKLGIVIAPYFGPAGLITAGIAAFTYLIVDNWKDIPKYIDRVSLAFEKLGITLQLVFLNTTKKLAEVFGVDSLFGISVGTISDKIKELEFNLNNFNIVSKNTEEPIARLRDFAKAGGDLDKIKFKGIAKEAPKFKELLAQLNKQLNTGKISLEEYYTALNKLEFNELKKDLNDGSINLKKFNEELLRLESDKLVRAFEAGKLSYQELQKELQKNEIQKLNMKFREGKMDVAEYHSQILALSNEFRSDSVLFTGVSDYLKSAGTLAQNIAGVISGTFSRLEDSLVNFIETGKFAFKDFAKEVISDINRIIVRALIIRPIAEGILGGIGSFGSGASSVSSRNSANSSGMGELDRYAKGGAFDGGVQFFAKGGIVDRPTAFGMSGGLGIMGERGSEAILPLRRGSDGSLGVEASGASSNVVVNIINQNNSEVETRETTNADGQKMIDVLITTRVKEGIARGDFDRTFNSAYGLRRKGN